MMGGRDNLSSPYYDLDEIIRENPLIKVHFLPWYGELLKPGEDNFQSYQLMEEKNKFLRKKFPPVMIVGRNDFERIELLIFQRKASQIRKTKIPSLEKSASVEEVLKSVEKRGFYAFFTNYDIKKRIYYPEIDSFLSLLENRILSSLRER